VEHLQGELDVANMKVHQLEQDNKTYLEQVDTAQTDVQKLNQHVNYYRTALEKQKLKVAEFLQKVFETGDV
jgi:outer membrane murein-binding lipoprotein Lpp